MIGESVGSYRVTRLLGQGGMGEVYLAEHKLIGRKAAIKVLHAKQTLDPSAVERFFTEARIAALVKHPGIVDIFDYGHLPTGAGFIVMDFLEGESLGARLKRDGRLQVDVAIEVARQVTSALVAAHGAGIVHRDLKPDNIFLLSSTDQAFGLSVKVLDFGIAKLASSPSLTRSGVVVGTPSYMAPEQCRGLRNIDARVDLYALGCVLFQMLCGRPPFVSQASGEVLMAHVKQRPPAPSSIVRDLPKAVDALVQCLLAKAPSDRPPSAGALLAKLEALAATLPAPPSTAASVGERGASRRAAGHLVEPGLTATSSSVPTITVPSGGFRRPWRTALLLLAGAAAVFSAAVVLVLVLVPHSPRKASGTAPTAKARRDEASAAVENAGSKPIVRPGHGGVMAPRDGRELGRLAPAPEANRSKATTAARRTSTGVEDDEFPPVGLAKRGDRLDADGMLKPTWTTEPQSLGTVQIALLTDPPGATVVRDSKVAGQTPLILRVARGPEKLKLTLKKTGYRDQDVSLDISRDGSPFIKLSPAGRAPK